MNIEILTNPKQAGERLLKYAFEGRLVQSVWHDERDGRVLACLLGAAAGIEDPKECSELLMPKWIAHVLTGLFDGQNKIHAVRFAIRWGTSMVRPEWERIQWEAVRDEWLAFIVAQANDAAAASANAATNAATASTYATAAATGTASTYAATASYAAAAAAAAGAAAVATTSYVAAYYAARDAQADALIIAIEKAMALA